MVTKNNNWKTPASTQITILNIRQPALPAIFCQKRHSLHIIFSAYSSWQAEPTNRIF
jgi:hypothetical protein